MPDLTLSQFDLVDATFTPRRTDDLKDGAAQAIGWRGTWQALWVIEDGPYAGEWHMLVTEPHLVNFTWAPSGDLTIHGRIDERVDQ